MTQDLAVRFWSKVAEERQPACWPFTGSRHPTGYGLFKIGSRTDESVRTERAHRVAYQLVHGPIPDGLHVLHRCDNRACCNPTHLFLGTNSENVADRVRKGRSSKGERQADAKLTSEKVRDARAIHAEGRSTVSAIARQFGVSHVTMWKAVHGQTWRHVQ